jgi:phenylalanyl-tRNA synthetase beta chain
MAVVELNKKLVLKYLKRKIPEDKLKEKIPMLGTDLDEITDEKISIDILPSRPDLLSEERFSRALNGFLGFEAGLKNYEVKESNYEVKIGAGVQSIRPYMACAVVKGLKIDEEYLTALMQMQEKLHATFARKRRLASIGMYDLNTIKFPLRYTTVSEDFAFTALGFATKMTISEILEKHPKGIEFCHLLPKEIFPIWVDANGEVLSLPPLINSAHTALTTKTRNVFVDVTGLSEKVVNQTLNIVICALADAGGKIYGVRVGKKKMPDLKGKIMPIDYGYINKILGLNLCKAEIKKYLERMRFGIKGDKATIPPYRVDILHQVDLAEDVAVAYGFENFKQSIPNISTMGGESKETIFTRHTSETMAGLGFLEVLNYALSNEEILCKRMRITKELLKTTNALNVSYTALRDALLPGLLKTLSENTHNSYPQEIYETGPVFTPKEENHLAAASSHSKTSFTEIKSVAEAFFRSLGKAMELKETEHRSFIKGRTAEIFINGKNIGIMGEIHPQVLNNFELENPVAVFEIDLDCLC